MSKQPPFTQEETKILQRIPKEIFLLSFIGALIFSFFNIITSLFILAGGILSAVSFFWIKDSLSKYFYYNNKKKVIGSFVGSYILRLLLIIAVFSIIIIFFSQRIFAFIAGFSTIILVFLAEAIVALSKIKKWKN